MAPPARSQNLCVLLTGLDSYLSLHLAGTFIEKDFQVYAVAKKAPEPLASERNFTLLDLDLVQPLPAYLPTFSHIFYFLEKEQTAASHYVSRNLPASLKNVINYSEAQIAIVASIRIAGEVIEWLAQKENVRIFLLGDIYGPDFDYKASGGNALTDLITQALTKGKIIMENEGREPIYPVYISDAIFALTKFALDSRGKKVRIIVSEPATTALEASYEIQDKIGAKTAVELFFSGSGHELKNIAQIHIRVADLGYEPKVKLEEGLEKIASSLKYQHQILQRSEHKQAVHFATTDSKKVGPKTGPKKHIGAKSFPKLRVFAKSKKLLILATLILLFFLGKTILDVSIGISSLKEAGQALTKFDFVTASQKSQISAKHLLSASRTIRLIPLTQVTSTLEGAVALSNSINYFSRGAESIAKNLQIITNPELKNSADFTDAASSLQKSYFLASNAKVRVNNRHTFLTRRFGDVSESAGMITTNSSQLLQFVHLIPDITGTDKPKTYLVLVQDNWHLRPGGGFIKAYGLLRFKNSRLENFSFDDIYSLRDSEKNKLSYKIGGNLKEKIEPSAEYSARLGIKQLLLRDSNTSADFSLNSARIRDLFTEQTGENLDGVIAINLTFLQNLLALTGPIQIKDTQISAENLNDIYLTSPANANLLPDLADKLFNQLTRASSSGGNLPYIELLQKTGALAAQKHFLASLDGTIISPFIKLKHLNNTLPPAGFDPANNRTETRDYLALAEANLGANEVNKFIERKIEYQLDVGVKANLLSTLKITYTNNSESPDWPQGSYINSLKVYVPQGTFITDYREDGTSKIGDIKVETEDSLTSFSTFVEIPPKSTKTLVFTYNIGKTLELEKAPAYHLYVQKQPGTLNDPLTFTLNLPAKFQIESVSGNSEDKGKQNFKTEKDLSLDREFNVNLTKH